MGTSTMCERQTLITKHTEADNFLEKEAVIEDRAYINSSPYDQVLPADEGPIMSYLRSWERRIGFVTPIIYVNAVSIILLHFVAVASIVYTACSDLRTSVKWQTYIFGLWMGGVAGFGVTAGVHRYWCHRSYKATRPMQILLLICYTVAAQNSVFDWVRDHRIHHKFSETSADPHDANRGFFFAHVGWLMMRKHPEVLRRGKQLDMSDITQDPLLRTYDKHLRILRLLGSFVIPCLVPVLCWKELWWNSIVSQLFTRYVLSLNCTWSVNSFAHLFGNKPYDKSIMPAENWAVSVAAMGEGWHNYHHCFPWDYKAAELPYTINFTAMMLDVFRRIGWVYDVRQATPSLISSVRCRKGEKIN